jgi:hypothetical protein
VGSVRGALDYLMWDELEYRREKRKGKEKKKEKREERKKRT